MSFRTAPRIAATGPPGPVRDARLPRVDRAQDAEVMAPRLRDLLGAGGALEVRLLKHVPGKRCVVGYTFADGTRAIGKLYRKDRARRHAASLSALESALRGDTRTPRLLACWDDLGLLVQEWVAGEPVPDWAELGGRDALVERLGRALADLHGARVRVGPRADLAAHLRRTCHPGLGVLREHLPQLGATLREVEEALYARERQLAQPVRPCHGDFSPRQLFVDGRRVTLVDMDGLCHSDPALDVANFRVGLQVHLGGRGSRLAESFTSAYLRARNIDSLPGLAHYDAFGWIRRAMIAWRKRAQDREERVHLFVERSRQCLAA